MHSLSRTVPTGIIRPISTLALLVGCTGVTTISPADAPSDATVRIQLPTELSFTSVLARAPMLDSARAVGGQGQVVVAGVLNQTAPCFELSSQGARTAARVTVRLIAKEKPGTCATFAAGAFDYSVAVKGLPEGSYDVEVFHRVDLQDGRSADTRIGTTRLQVR